MLNSIERFRKQFTDVGTLESADIEALLQAVEAADKELWHQWLNCNIPGFHAKSYITEARVKMDRVLINTPAWQAQEAKSAGNQG